MRFQIPIRLHACVVVLLTALLSANASATAPVTAGTVYQVAGASLDGLGCGDPNPLPDPFTGSFKITNVVGSGPFLFDATLLITDDVPTTVTLSAVPLQVNGVFGPASGTFTDADGGNGTVSGITGVATSSTISFSGSFAEISPNPSCSGTFAASGTGNPALDPATSAPAQQTQQSDALAALSPSGVVGQVTRYTGGLVSQRRGGLDVTANSMSFSSRGLSAGDPLAMPVGVWMVGAFTTSEDDFAVAPFESDRFNLTGGIDTSWDDTYVLGLSLGAEVASTKTSANNGEQDTLGFTIAPYFAVLLDDNVSVDMAIGYSRLFSDQSRGRGTPITSDAVSKRWFFAANGNWTKGVGNWFFTGRGGMVWLSSDLESYIESDGTFNPTSVFRVAQVNFGGEAAYSYGEWEPYVGATLSHAYSKTRRVFAANVNAPEDDRTDVLVNLGVRFYGADGVSGGAEYSTLLLRDNFTEHSFQLNVRAEF